ncbi:cupredoxin domain-containing protein [Aureispira anguillae]|uniref:Cupredoxin domain-containing protein n=1 Tax=Aureispira anguillae TaxID=2864201 RepID=A0A915YHQ8_9BACT|nr:cupredoxin domain-containing protein [Aureispira anguillae]BDS13283.1 cupredoxin domain-containing protein [Aureispira anguillae]
MKNKLVAILFLLVAVVNFGYAQEHTSSSVIKLEQTPGKFTVQSLTLEAGTYQFEIANKGINHEVGFVIAPKGKPEQKYHIKEGYVQKTIKAGETSLTKQVSLEKGEYIYFCPLNPTPHYTLIVQ